jgi:tetratricopeptide (TPR) repeat protein
MATVLTPPAVSHREALYLEVLAFNFLQHDRYEPALTLYQSLQALYPDVSKYFLAEAFIQLQLHHFEAATVQAEKAEALSQNFRNQYFARLLKSKALWRLGEEEKAQQVLVEFLQVQRRE